MKVHLLRPSNSWRQMWGNSGPSSWLRRKVEVAAGGRCYCRVPCYCSCCLLWGVPTFRSAGESVGRTHLVEPPQTKGVDGLLDRRGS